MSTQQQLLALRQLLDELKQEVDEGSLPEKVNSALEVMRFHERAPIFMNDYGLSLEQARLLVYVCGDSPSTRSLAEDVARSLVSTEGESSEAVLSLVDEINHHIGESFDPTLKTDSLSKVLRKP